MKKILYVLLAIIILLVGAVLVVPMVIDPNDYKQQLATAIEEKTGYKLDISGKVSLSVLPSAKASVDGVAISAGKAEAFAKVKELHVYMSLLPLLDGKIEVDEIRLVEPKINLVQKGSSNNWTAVKPKSAPAKEKAADGSGTKRELNVRDFSITDGEVTFNNNGNVFKVEDINLDSSFISNELKLDKVAAKIFGGSLDAKGKVNLTGTPKTELNFEGRGFDLGAIAEGVMRNKRIEKGTADINGSFTASGNTPDKVSASLNGKGDISARDLAIRGFDMGKFSENIQRIKSPTDIVPILNSFRGESQSTKINSIAGDFTVKNGLVNIPGIKMEADYAQGDYNGTIDLPRSSMNTHAKFNLLSVDKAATPKVGLKISGPMSSPSLNPDLSDLTNWAIKKYGSKLIDKVPEKYKGFIPAF